MSGLLWPSRSLITGTRHGGDGPLSIQDFVSLTFLDGSGCRACALPLEIDLGEVSLCAACSAKPPVWDQARAALAYDDYSRRPILELKHAGRRDGLNAMGTWLTSAGYEILPQTDYLIPVPLHYRRLAKRGFNQSAWLAQAVSRRSRTPVLVDGLVRHRATPTQGGLSANARRRNVAGAFRMRERHAERLSGATVTLVDDVYTTGATLKACTRALRKGGVAHVNLLVLARVVREADVTI